mgnify:CR=1 FL=1
MALEHVNDANFADNIASGITLVDFGHLGVVHVKCLVLFSKLLQKKHLMQNL